MKTFFSILVVLSASSASTNAQQSTAKIVNPAVVTPTPGTSIPVKNDLPAAILPGQGHYQRSTKPEPFSAADANKQIEAQKKVNAEIEKRIESEHSKGIITVNFGIVKQGEQTQAFCPFNITTLESQETTRTPGVNIGSLKRYSLWNSPSSISDVTVGFGPLMAPYKGTTKGTVGNGFFVTYVPTTQVGAVDEMITFFTGQGNITYRLLGYVYAKDDEITVSK